MNITHAPTRLAKVLLPKPGIDALKRFKAFWPKFILQTCAQNPRLSSIYYAVFSTAFQREHHGVLYGKTQYFKDLEQCQQSSYLLRRNVHRLEKGLIMRPRRLVFAVDYIEETVAAYGHAVRQQTLPGDELQWATDVLGEYFSVVGTHPVVDEAKSRYLALQAMAPKGKPTESRIPYRRDLSQPAAVSYDQFLQLCHRRRSVRWYLQKPVPRALIDKAVLAAGLSPSACNRQPFEFRVFDDLDWVAQVARVPGGTKGFNHNFPVIVAVVGKLRAYFDERDRHVIYIDGALASMSFVYALETLGLSSCCINWPDVDATETQMATLLSLEPDERIVMLISVGYPDPEGMVPYSQKKPLDQLRRYNG
jgi:nitroreductase